MGPHTNDFDSPFLVENLIDEAMLDVDAAGEGPGEIPHQLLKGRRAFVRLPAKDFEQSSALSRRPLRAIFRASS
jgi:hypothetical protein